jgi:hypothetical protein
MRAPGVAIALMVAGALAGGGCTVTRTFTETNDGGADATVTACIRGIPSVQLANMRSTCAGDFAARTFRFALCSCADLDLAATFGTDSFDGTVGPYTPAATAPGGAPVGTNGNASVQMGAEVQGTLVVAGMGPSTIGDNEIIHGDLKTAGDLVVGSTVLVVRDAWIHGNLTAPSGMSIARNLFYPPGVVPPLSLAVGYMKIPGDFSVQPPCACDTGRADILAAVKDARGLNNNEVAALAPGYLADPHPTGPIHLPCGRYYVDEVWGTAPVRLVIEGHVVLFVGGNFVAWDGLALDVAADGELDVFVGGNFTLGTAQTWGEPLHAGSVRFYAAGPSTTLGTATMFAGNLYAPTATLVTQPIEIFGSIAAAGVGSTDGLAIHFDRSVLDSGADCDGERVRPSCGTSSDCQGIDGCVAGACGGCQKDSDCCDPLVCDPSSNRCEQLQFPPIPR